MMRATTPGKIKDPDAEVRSAEVTDLAQRGMVAAHEAMMKNGGGMMGRGMTGRGMRGNMNDQQHQH